MDTFTTRDEEIQIRHPETDRLLIRNAIITPDGTLLESVHRHDYQIHLDANGNQYMVDGGLDYQRRSNNGDERNACLYNDEPHSVQREVLKWGTYGKDGNQPLRWIAIKDMETSHIDAVLHECRPAKVFKDCMFKELEFRNGPDYKAEES